LFAYSPTYSDSDWARNPDDRRSTTRYALFLEPCLVSWCAKKQPVVSKSITEIEYKSLAFATAELCCLRMLFKELDLFLPCSPALWCDNVSTLALASNPLYHARTKHIEVDYHFIREKVVNKDVKTSYISTDEQIADIFTKGLTTIHFLWLRDKLKVCSPPISFQGMLEHKLSSTVATSTSPSHQVEENTVAAKAPIDSALTHDILKGAAKTRSFSVDKREDTHTQGKS
jgi:hypothetical protein